MLDCVTLENSHFFDGNPICEQHKLRYREIIKRQGWEVPTVKDMEYDGYDNPAAYYLIKRDEKGEAIASSRFYPTDRPYMLEQVFSHLVTKKPMPKDPTIWEGSRFCIARKLQPEDRKKAAQELVLGYLEFGLAMNIESIIGVMYPVYWKSLFLDLGCDIEWLGDVQKSAEGYKIIAGALHVSERLLRHVRQVTGIHDPVISFGQTEERGRYAA